MTRYGLGSLVFLLVFLVPGLTYGWLNYILPASRSPPSPMLSSLGFLFPLVLTLRHFS